MSSCFPGPYIHCFVVEYSLILTNEILIIKTIFRVNGLEKSWFLKSDIFHVLKGCLGNASLVRFNPAFTINHFSYFMNENTPIHQPQLSFLPDEENQGRPVRSRNDDLSRQVKNLLLLYPVTRLEADKNRLGPDQVNLFDGVDTLYLSFSLFDYISECMLFDKGADREGILEHLESEVNRFQLPVNEPQKRLIGSIILDQLCNSKDNHKSFQLPYFDPLSNQTQIRDFRLILFKVTDAGEGRYMLTNEGFSAYLSMLELNTEMGQEVDEFLIKRQMERGNFRDAVRIAQRNRKRTIELKDTLERKVFKMGREIQNVDWSGEIRPFLERSRVHIKERIEEEGSLLSKIEEYIQESEQDRLIQLVTLKETLLECQSKHRELHAHLMRVNETFLEEQTRSYRAPRYSSHADFEEDILAELLGCEIEKLQDKADEITAMMNLPGQPHLFDPLLLLSFIDQADAEERNAEPPKKAEIIDFDQPLDRFDRSLVIQMKSRLEAFLEEKRDTSFSEVIGWAETTFNDKDEIICLIYLVLQWFGDPAEKGIPEITKLENKLALSGGILSGDDLAIRYIKENNLSESEEDPGPPVTD